MMPIRTVLLPTDFSAPSEVALELACSLARGYGARLILLHVAAYEMTGEGMMAAQRDPVYYRDALNEVCDRVIGPDPGFPVETCLREGPPAEEILRAADDLEADLIVMGSHGRTGLGRLLMGSVAEAVLRRAGCPVLLAKKLAGKGRGTTVPGDATSFTGRVIVTEGSCDCGVHSAHVIHRDFPEHWAEGCSPAEGAASLEAKLVHARDNCPGGWHHDDLSRAIEEVRAFRTTLTPAGAQGAVKPAVGAAR
jgi:nucleotide-binding universal stress UspA family protein